MTALRLNGLPKDGLARGKQTCRCWECLHHFTPKANAVNMTNR